MKHTTTTAPAVILDTAKNQPSGLHFTLNHTGKMQGIHSLSTSCKGNAQCQKNAQIKGSICEHCFSFAMMKRYTNLDGCMQRNAEILRAGIIPADQWPVTTGQIFRLESFGDLANWMQAANYLNFARRNPQTRFSLYTKNPRFVAEAIAKGYEKPENLVIVFSSLFLNARAKAPYPFIDKVFTVYETEDKAPDGINCGARNCFACQRCYRKNPDGVKVEHISELLK